MASPIATLHPELLAEVFMHYTSLVEDPIHDYRTRPYARITVSHVCKYWRAVALQFPRFWSHLVVTSNRACMSEILRRSKQSLLDVGLHVHGYHKDSLVESARLVLGEIHRIRALWISTHSCNDPLNLEDLFRMPAPQLRILYLASSDGQLAQTAFQLFRYFMDPGLLSLDSYGTCAPRLERLELLAFEFRWSDLTMSTLRRLTVSRHTLAPRQSIDELLHALAPMQLLESIDITESSYPSTTPSERLLSPHSITLPHLKYMRLETEAHDCAHILTALSAPALQRMAVEFRNCGDDVSIVSSIAVHVHTLPAIHAIYFTSLDSEYVQNKTLIYGFELPPDVDLYGSAHKDRFLRDRPSPTIKIAFHDAAAAAHYMARVWKHLTVGHHVRMLEVEDCDVTQEAWRNICGNLKGLTMLRVGKRCANQTLLDTLKERASEAEDAAVDGGVFLPRLHTLDCVDTPTHLHNIAYVHHTYHGSDFTVFQEALRECLIVRSKLGGQLLRLRFPGANYAQLEPHEIRDFEALVPEVTQELPESIFGGAELEAPLKDPKEYVN